MTVKLNHKIRKQLRRFQICVEQDWTCKYCFCPVTWSTVTLDHKTPRLEKSGQNRWGPTYVLFASCYDCNIRRSNMPFDEFIRMITSDTVTPPDHLLPIRARRKYYKDGDLSVELLPAHPVPYVDRTKSYRVNVVETFTAIMCGRAE